MTAEESKAWENRRAEVAEAELLTMRSLIDELRKMLEQLREVEAELSLSSRRPGDCVPKEAVEDARAEGRREGQREGWLAAAKALGDSGDMYLERGEAWLIERGAAR